MFSILVTSLTPGSGKTSTALTVASDQQEKGKKISFIKPVINGLPGSNTIFTSDVVILKQLLQLPEPAETLSPNIPDAGSLKIVLKSLLTTTLSGKDVVIIESPFRDLKLNREIADFIQARILGVEGFQHDLSDSIHQYRGLGNCLVGVIVNKVPATRINEIKKITFNSGLKMVGIIPEERTLIGLTVHELADGINGKITNDCHHPEDFIENFMVGVLDPDHESEYYTRKKNKVVILGSDRADMQLSALETPLMCLVLAGPKAPVPVVMNRAEARQVPMVLVNRGVSEVIAELEGIFNKNVFSERKTSRTLNIFRQYLNLDILDH